MLLPFCGGGRCLVLISFAVPSVFVVLCNHFTEQEGAGCFTFIVFLLFFYRLPLSRDEADLSAAVCNDGISPYNSLTIYICPFVLSEVNFMIS